MQYSSTTMMLNRQQLTNISADVNKASTASQMNDYECLEKHVGVRIHSSLCKANTVYANHLKRGTAAKKVS